MPDAACATTCSSESIRPCGRTCAAARHRAARAKPTRTKASALRSSICSPARNRLRAGARAACAAEVDNTLKARLLAEASALMSRAFSFEASARFFANADRTLAICLAERRLGRGPSASTTSASASPSGASKPLSPIGAPSASTDSLANTSRAPRSKTKSSSPPLGPSAIGNDGRHTRPQESEGRVLAPRRTRAKTATRVVQATVLGETGHREYRPHRTYVRSKGGNDSDADGLLQAMSLFLCV